MLAVKCAPPHHKITQHFPALVTYLYAYRDKLSLGSQYVNLRPQVDVSDAKDRSMLTHRFNLLRRFTGGLCWLLVLCSSCRLGFLGRAHIGCLAFVQAMLPLFERLFKETRLVIKRHLVWEDTPNFQLMQMYDAKTKCR